MNLNECIDFANQNKVCYLATCDDDQPRVRALGFWYADTTGFYFQTGIIKAFYKQLLKNPKTEVCFYTNGGSKMLRICGSVEFIQDKALKEKAMEDRPFLKDFGLTVDSPGLILFRIAHGSAHFWTMENNLKPKVEIRF